MRVIDRGQVDLLAKGVLSAVKYASAGGKPQLRGTDMKGNPVDLTEESGDGRVVVVDFWATWCGPCIAAIPHHRELKEHFSGRPYELITVSVDDELETALEFMEETDMPFVNWYLPPEGKEKLLADWQIPAFPTMIILDGKGVVRARTVGMFPMIDQVLEKLVTEQEAANW